MVRSRLGWRGLFFCFLGVPGDVCAWGGAGDSRTSPPPFRPPSTPAWLGAQPGLAVKEESPHWFLFLATDGAAGICS